MSNKYETESFSFGVDDVHIRIRGKGERSSESVIIPKSEFGKALVGLGIVQIATVQFQPESAAGQEAVSDALAKGLRELVKDPSITIPETAVVAAGAHRDYGHKKTHHKA